MNKWLFIYFVSYEPFYVLYFLAIGSVLLKIYFYLLSFTGTSLSEATKLRKKRRLIKLKYLFGIDMKKVFEIVLYDSLIQ